MNRIILIGNGFDLAHGLPTRYEDFINWYWEQWVVKLKKCNNSTLSDEICSFSIKSGRNTWSCFMYTSGYTLYPPKGVDFVNSIAENKSLQITLSPLLTRICKSIQDKNWVDIEWEYYNLLRNKMLVPDCYDYTIAELNGHLHYIQELLVQYLSSITNIAINYNEQIFQQLFGNIRKNDISISQLHAYYDYVEYLISHADDEYKFILGRYGLDKSDIYFNAKELKELQKYSKSGKIEEIYLKDLICPANIMLLNFNYTGVADIYGTKKVSTVNHIHGSLNSPSGIIFGYGDELDDDYKNLLKQTDAGCLNNIKSIKYLESDNYRNLLKFIESAPYQVYIMGHSCGNSDRTLLNTLFEHKNCVSIKPYYYQKEDGSDNYMEIVQNICRNFTDMKLMRDRVVNKTFCEPLPQVKR